MDFDSKESTLSELVTPEMANFAGKLHGGELLSLADKAAYVSASRYSGEYCVTARFDHVDFHEPVEVGELIVFHAYVIDVGESSMVVEIEVSAEDMEEGTTRKCATCYVTMVAVEDGEPVEVPDLECRTEEEFSNCLWAKRRKQLTEEHRQTLKREKARIEGMDKEEIKNELRQSGK